MPEVFLKVGNCNCFQDCVSGIQYMAYMVIFNVLSNYLFLIIFNIAKKLTLKIDTEIYFLFGSVSFSGGNSCFMGKEHDIKVILLKVAFTLDKTLVNDKILRTRVAT